MQVASGNHTALDLLPFFSSHPCKLHLAALHSIFPHIHQPGFAWLADQVDMTGFRNSVVFLGGNSGWLNLSVFCFVFGFCSLDGWTVSLFSETWFWNLLSGWFSSFFSGWSSLLLLASSSSLVLVVSASTFSALVRKWFRRGRRTNLLIYNFFSIFHSGICVAQLLLVGLMLKLA